MASALVPLNPQELKNKISRLSATLITYQLFISFHVFFNDVLPAESLTTINLTLTFQGRLETFHEA